MTKIAWNKLITRILTLLIIFFVSRLLIGNFYFKERNMLDNFWYLGFKRGMLLYDTCLSMNRGILSYNTCHSMNREMLLYDTCHSMNREMLLYDTCYSLNKRMLSYDVYIWCSCSSVSICFLLYISRCNIKMWSLYKSLLWNFCSSSLDNHSPLFLVPYSFDYIYYFLHLLLSTLTSFHIYYFPSFFVTSTHYLKHFLP